MPVENIIILLAAWITSLGLLGVVGHRLCSSRCCSRQAGERMRFEPTRAAAHRNGRMHGPCVILLLTSILLFYQ